jgi:hypothetical protein
MRSFKKDLQIGIKNEKRILKLLKERFNDTENKIRLNKNKYGFYDIIDETNRRFYEIKKRNYNFSCFPDWMIGFDKYEKYLELKKNNKERYFGYSLYLIQSNKDNDYYCLLSRKRVLKIQNFKRDDRIDHIDIEKKYLYINSNFFKCLDRLKKNKKII